MLAVIAQGLSRSALADHARSRLLEEQGLSAETVDSAVKHLRGDELQRQEQALLPLARASIRYEPSHIQQSVQEHVQSLSRTETIAGIATIGLSNALARLDGLPS